MSHFPLMLMAIEYHYICQQMDSYGFKKKGMKIQKPDLYQTQVYDLK